MEILLSLVMGPNMNITFSFQAALLENTKLDSACSRLLMILDVPNRACTGHGMVDLVRVVAQKP